jgi:hypothetical protein
MLSNAALCAKGRSGAGVRTIVSFPKKRAGAHITLLSKQNAFGAMGCEAARHSGLKYDNCRAISRAADSNYCEDR